MIKALFKKQMMEVFSWVYRDAKTGKRRGKAGAVGYILLYLFVFASLGMVFGMMASSLCAPLTQAGLGWLYMALMGMVAVVLGVFGSVFNTYSSLYQAKDNDMLLSMPIPPSKILLVRLSGVYLTGLMYELIVMVPALVVFFADGNPTVAGVVFSLLLPLLLSLLVLALSAVLGYVVGLVTSRLKNKNFLTVLLSLAFIVGYYYVYRQAYAIIGKILADPANLGSKVKTILYPFYQMGLAACGNGLSMLIFAAMMGLLFGVVYLVLSRSFLKIATANRGTVRVKYREKALKVGNAKSALLKKELRRFLGSPTYMLNCGLGLLFMPIAAVALLLKREVLVEMINQLFGGATDVLALVAVAAVCTISSMSDISAPSVSLEGKNLWLVRSMPVRAADALMAKLKLHLYLTLAPTMVLCAVLVWVIRPVWYFAVLIFAASAVFVLLTAAAGLWLNLKMPNLNWVNEAVPVKQSMSVTLELFGGWGLVIALCGAYYGLASYIPAVWYLLGVTVLLLALSGVLVRWIKTRGAAIFEAL